MANYKFRTYEERQNDDGTTDSIIGEFDCNQCGKHLYASIHGEPECPKCGALYNRSGQRLRDDWRSNPSNHDDDIGDLEGFEIQHAE